jgi:ribosomal protein L37AE/L43A
MSDNRVDATMYHLERVFGAKVPQCPNCRSHDLWENHARACWHCDGCGYDIAGERMTWVPKDPRVRRPEEQPA